MLLDSNIIIYASKMSNVALLKFLKEEEHSIVVSSFSKIEVLGYHQLKKMEKLFLEKFFDSISIIPIDEKVVNKAIELKQQRPMEDGDAIIAATAIVKKLPLLTENVKDFDRISSLEIISMKDIL